MTALYTARGLHKTYAVGGGLKKRQRLRAVHNVDLALERGKVLAVVGESGSGKSTIGRLLARLEGIDSGTMTLDGQPLPKKITRAFRQRVQMVFQDPFGSLNPVHSILHHLARPLLLHGKATKADVREKAIALLDRVGLSPGEEYVDRMPHAVSGGQRQRVAIARALAPQPDVIIADEPTSMLDVSSRLSVLQLLESLVKDGIALMLITHDLAAARYLSDDVLVLYAGQVVEAGPIADVIDRPAHPYTRLLLSAIPEGPGALDPLDVPPGQPDRIAPLTTCPFLNRCPVAVPACQNQLPPLRDLAPAGRVLCHREDPRRDAPERSRRGAGSPAPSEQRAQRGAEKPDRADGEHRGFEREK
jgi:oligopeptide/dipeptide ABC transporter ATP-binding protein